MIRLELKRVRDALYRVSDGVVSLEKDKMSMETAMKERREEIRLHVEMLRQQLKAANSERYTVNTELHNRVSFIDKLKKRSATHTHTHTHSLSLCLVCAVFLVQSKTLAERASSKRPHLCRVHER